MRTAAIALGAIGLAALTAGCVQDSQYPGYGYGSGYAPAYGSNYAYASGYPSTAYSSGYQSYPAYAPAATYGPSYAVTSNNYRYQGQYQASAPSRSQRYWNSSRRDYDRDGIPNRYDRDANGDGVPDRWQGR